MRPRRLVSLLIAGCMMVSLVPASAVTAFAETASDTSVSEDADATQYAPYYKLVEAIEKAKDGDTVKLTEDVDVKMTLAISKKTLTLDLNGYKLYNTSDLWDYYPTDQKDNWSLVSVREGGDLTITGNGTLDAKADDCHAVDVQDGAKLTIEDGTFIGNIHAVYVHTGEAYIKGGHFSIKQEYPDADKAYEFVLNLYDKNREPNLVPATAKIVVTGGEFEKFNPADCKAEGAGTNFCAPGYTTKKVGDNYIVEIPDYNNIDAKADVDEDPEDKNPDTPNEGTIGEPVEIAVTAKGEGVQYIDTLTLEFSDPEVVSDVSIKKGEQKISLTEKYDGNYKNLSIAELEALFDENTDEPENGIATLADDPDDASTAAKTKIDFEFLVTYTKNGDHSVNFVFKDAGEKEVTKVTAPVQIGPKADDAGKDDNTGDNTDSGDGAGAVIAGVVLGTGAVVLAYHVGTEIYAEQVLGQGVAVPSTREEVALKAWELAGKPAVAVEGEPLSETAQAERWVVESGLMQNESDGTFNGQKKMTKLAALHTLSEAKKLG